MVRALTSRQLGIDIGVAAVLVIIAIAYTAQTGYIGFAETAVSFGLGAALALRRFSPPLALGFAWLIALLQMMLRQDPGLADLAILPILYSTAAYGPSVLRWLGFASTFVGAGIATLYTVTVPALLSYATPSVIYDGLRAGLNGELATAAQSTLIVFTGSLAVFILSWVLGVLTRAFSRSEASRAAQAAAENDRLLAEQAVIVEQERNRIARDMHDIVAHSLAVVIAQADGARYLHAASAMGPVEGADDLVGDSLTTIATTARGALADVRVLLGELRHQESTAPQPGLGELDDLAAQFRSTGLAVELHSSGIPSPLGATRELAVYRIVQEALTNTLRHADQSKPVVVALDWGREDLWLTVTSALLADRGAAAADLAMPARAPSAAVTADRSAMTYAGHGIPGMVERAALAGGHLAAAPRGTLFVVSAQLPVPAESVATASVSTESDTAQAATQAATA
ncbi:hypothetical protein B7R54_01270 [Subtercola boreus]|uniref:histidine kinase n=1 Tax=Subtercola boreus TaxID=120213 RepID=A0A3E0VEB8_9MICO|nr:histidine kinase [Subtercola boreus]RFA07999.1 hypothetical protein B7R54_01270 [Subtercola boreus]TQL55135.1 signal transduction histidine kinase [Subtercola boreus]